MRPRHSEIMFYFSLRCKCNPCALQPASVASSPEDAPLRLMHGRSPACMGREGATASPRRARHQRTRETNFPTHNSSNNNNNNISRSFNCFRAKDSGKCILSRALGSLHRRQLSSHSARPSNQWTDSGEAHARPVAIRPPALPRREAGAHEPDPRVFRAIPASARKGRG